MPTDFKVLLTDFGFAIKRSTLKDEARYPCLGTPTHFAYEMVCPYMVRVSRDGREIEEFTYDERVDIWCLGIILYALLFKGVTPFETANFDKEVTKERIKKLKFKFPNNEYPEGCDLIK